MRTNLPGQIFNEPMDCSVGIWQFFLLELFLIVSYLLIYVAPRFNEKETHVSLRSMGVDVAQAFVHRQEVTVIEQVLTDRVALPGSLACLFEKKELLPASQLTEKFLL